MNRAKTQPQSTSGSVAMKPTQTRLSGVSLLIARAVWLALVIPSLGLTVVSFPVYDQRLQAWKELLEASVSSQLQTNRSSAFRERKNR